MVNLPQEVRCIRKLLVAILVFVMMHMVCQWFDFHSLKKRVDRVRIVAEEMSK